MKRCGFIWTVNLGKSITVQHECALPADHPKSKPHECGVCSTLTVDSKAQRQRG